MKTRTVTILLAAMLALAFQANAQDYVFKVLVNKGNNVVKVGKDWTPLKTGATLKSSDEIKLVDNSYLGLIHSTGKPLEIKLPGTYTVTALSAKVGPGATVLNKYTDFILSSNSDEAKKNRLSATGAVHRGGNSTKIYLPKSDFAVFFEDSVVLDWEKEEGSAPVTYVVTLKSMFGDELFKTETTKETVSLHLADPSFINEDNIIVEVYPKGQENKAPDPPYMVKRLSAADRERIKPMLAELAGQADQKSALSKLSLAGFYEQNKLIIDAGSAYLEAMQLAPDVPEYREYYKEFLIRNNIITEKKDK
jgi:hypothetical protein